MNTLVQRRDRSHFYRLKPRDYDPIPAFVRNNIAQANELNQTVPAPPSRSVARPRSISGNLDVKWLRTQAIWADDPPVKIYNEQEELEGIYARSFPEYKKQKVGSKCNPIQL